MGTNNLHYSRTTYPLRRGGGGVFVALAPLLLSSPRQHLLQAKALLFLLRLLYLLYPYLYLSYIQSGSHTWV